jgi:hypothetical protein
MTHVKKHKVSKKPSKRVIKLARKYKVKISLKRGSKRVYKSEKLILKQVKKKMRTLRKSRKSARKVVRKTRRTRRSRFGGFFYDLLPDFLIGKEAAEKREIEQMIKRENYEKERLEYLQSIKGGLDMYQLTELRELREKVRDRYVAKMEPIWAAQRAEADRLERIYNENLKQYDNGVRTTETEKANKNREELLEKSKNTKYAGETPWLVGR